MLLYPCYGYDFEICLETYILHLWLKFLNMIELAMWCKSCTLSWWIPAYILVILVSPIADCIA